MSGTPALTLHSPWRTWGIARSPVNRRGKIQFARHGLKDATVDPKQIEAWWTETPDPSIGLPAAGLMVVDRDGQEDP